MFMKKRLLSGIAILCVFSSLDLASGQTAKSPGDPAEADVRAMLTDRLVPGTDTGMVVGLIAKGNSRIIAAGKSGAAGSPAPGGDTIFEIGSATKVFTTTLLAIMAERGEVRLEDPAAQYLPSSVKVPERNGRKITLLDLATHQSGLPRLPTNLNPRDPANPYADYTVEQLYAFLSGYQLPRDIGAQFEYSNLGMGLLGHILSLKAGIGYEALVTRLVLEPLQMKDTGITLRPGQSERFAQGHDSAGRAVAAWDLPTLAGAGALRSTVQDMLKFAAANLAGTGPLATALRSTHQARAGIGTPDGSVALGWLLRHAFDTEIVWHNGGTAGFHSFIGFDLKNGAAVVILHNSAASIDDIGFHLLDSRFPIVKPPSAPKPRKETVVAAAILDSYVGQYQLAPAFVMTVTRTGEQLFIQATGQARLPVFAESQTDFFYKVVDAQVTFIKDANGQVTGLILHQGGRDTPGRKVK